MMESQIYENKNNYAIYPPPKKNSYATDIHQNKPRIEYIDLAKGMCILLVVVRHTFKFYGNYNEAQMPFSSYIFTFDMPLFFFLSGLFFNTYNGLKDFITRKTNKLLVTFFFFYIVTCIGLKALLSFCDIPMDGAEGLRVVWSFACEKILPNGPLWFLLCLFWVNLFFYSSYIVSDKIGKTENKKLAWLIAFTLLGGYAGVMMGMHDIILPMFADTALTCMPFFGAGYIFRKHTQILYPNSWDKWLLPMMLLAAGMAYVFRGGMYFWNNTFSVSPIKMYIGGLTGTLAVMLLAKRIGRLPLVSYWGRYSIVILCTHYVIAQLLAYAFKESGMTAQLDEKLSLLTCLVCTLAVCTVLIPLCVRYLPWFTAQKDLIRIKTK